MGDLSSQSGDHGITDESSVGIDDRSRARPGHAHLRRQRRRRARQRDFGRGAFSARERHEGRCSRGDAGTNGGQAQGAADLWWGNRWWALHASGGGQSERRLLDARGHGRQHAGAERLRVGRAVLDRARRGHLGANYAYEDTRYGLPFVEEGQVELTPRRSIVNVRGEHEGPQRLLRVDSRFVRRPRYQHEEIVAGRSRHGIPERHARIRVPGQLIGRTGRFSGSIGARALDRSVLCRPATRRSRLRSTSAGWRRSCTRKSPSHHATLQLGGRFDHASYTPKSDALPSRDFFGVLGVGGPASFKPPVFGSPVEHRCQLRADVPLSGARRAVLLRSASRQLRVRDRRSRTWTPSMPSASTLSFRWRSSRFSARRRTSATASATTSSAIRLKANPEEGFPVVEFVAATACSRAPNCTAMCSWPEDLRRFRLDYVRGDAARPRRAAAANPLFRARGSVRYQVARSMSGGEATGVSAQDRVFGDDTRLTATVSSSCSRRTRGQTGKGVSTMTARLDNAYQYALPEPPLVREGLRARAGADLQARRTASASIGRRWPGAAAAMRRRWPRRRASRAAGSGRAPSSPRASV